MPTPTVEDVFAQAMQLATTERAALLQRLLVDAGEDDLEGGGAEWETAFPPDLMERREERLRRGDDYLLDAEESVERIRRSLPPASPA